MKPRQLSHRPQCLLFLLVSACTSEEESSPLRDASSTTVPSSGGMDFAGNGGASMAFGGSGAAGGTSSDGGARSTGGERTSRGGGFSSGGSSTGGAPSGGAHSTGSPDAGLEERDASDAPSLPGWTLVWNDEFNGPAGTGPDTANWTRETGGHGWGNNELEYYTDRTDNAAMDGRGSLVITARSESYMGRDYTSARLMTQGHFEHTYGRFEARLQIPRGQGIWPAFWLLGNDIGSVGWPSCGEIDVMENIGREPTIVHGTLHGPGYSGGNGIGASYSLPNETPFADDYHVYAVEWEADEARWYVDGIEYQSRTRSDLPGEWVYDHPFFIILNVAVGGQWPGNPDETTVLPQQMRVDYVRVYDRAP